MLEIFYIGQMLLWRTSSSFAQIFYLIEKMTEIISAENKTRDIDY